MQLAINLRRAAFRPYIGKHFASIAGRIQGKVRMTFLALVLLACAKADSEATTVLVDELDASRFRMRAE